MAKETVAAAAAPKPVFNFDTFMKANVHLSDDAISGQFRGADVKKNVSIKDIEKLSFGPVNSSIRIDQVFKLVSMRMINQDVQGAKRDLLLFIIQNPKGEQRAIYASSLFRSTPTADSINNQYEDNVKNFDRGILQDLGGATTPKLIEALIGDGSSYIKVEDEISWVTKGVRQVDGPKADTDPTQKAGAEFEAQQRAYRLVHVTEADATATV